MDRRPSTELTRDLPPLTAGAKPPDHTLELLAQPVGVGPEPPDRQKRFDQLPLVIAEFASCHPGFVPVRRASRSRIHRTIDHDSVQALVL